MSSEITVFEFNRLKFKSMAYDILKEKMVLLERVRELDLKESNILSQIAQIDAAEQKSKEAQLQTIPDSVPMNVDPQTGQVIQGKESKKSVGPTVRKAGE